MAANREIDTAKVNELIKEGYEHIDKMKRNPDLGIATAFQLRDILEIIEAEINKE